MIIARKVLKQAGISDDDVRRLIEKADQENMPMAKRVIHVPASIGTVYGCEIRFDSNIDHAELRAPKVEYHRVRL